MSFFQDTRERLQPALRLPLVRVLAPQRLVTIARLEVREDGDPSVHHYFFHECAVATANGL